MNEIQLRLVNQSQGTPDVVVFQQNVAAPLDEIVVAWRVIQGLGYGDSHTFPFPLEMRVAASDSWGNFTPQMPARAGQMFGVVMATSGMVLQDSGPATSASDVQVVNGMTQGAINASMFRDGRLLAIKTNVVPGQMATFEFDPTIWIGAVSQIIEGDIMDSAIVQSVNTQLSLLGISAADILMTGGGPGTSSSPYRFALQNVVRA